MPLSEEEQRARGERSASEGRTGMRTVTMERLGAAAGDARGMKSAACRLRHVTLFYSFFGPVVALMSSYSRRGRNRSATRPDITSRATQLRAKGLSRDLRGDSTRTDGGEREPFISGTASPRAG